VTRTRNENAFHNTRAARLTIQLAEEKVRGLPGVGLGIVLNRAGEINTTTAQAENPAPQIPTTLRSSKQTKTGMGILHWARVHHMLNCENTHAEDKLSILMVQHAVLGKVPPGGTVVIPEFFVSASPCTSSDSETTVGGKKMELEATSDKSTGCTENLITWHNTGVDFGESGCNHILKLKIGHLTVDHLYKGNRINEAYASYMALERLKAAGAIDRFTIEHGPPLKDFTLPLTK